MSVLFGGTTSGDIDGVLGDTWTWNGVAWTKLTPKTSPSARFGFDMVYSATLKAIVLYGGAAANAQGDYTPQGDTWTWNGTTWTLLTRRATDPPPLVGHSLAFDGKRGVVVLYGGLGADDNLDVWELGTTGWANRAHAASSPGSLDAFVMTYDDRLPATVTFGGTSPAGITDSAAAVGDTYTWDGTVWAFQSVKGPSARSGSAGAFDAKRGRTVIFGGTDVDGIDSDETWEFGGGAWTLRTPTRKPTPLSNARLTYDVGRDRIVSFGGYSFFAEGETWEYGHFGSACHTQADCDGASCVDGVCCQVAACDTCEACGSATGTCEPIHSGDDVNGSCTGDKTCNSVGACVAKGSAGCKLDAECATGHCADGVCCDGACGGACQSCTVPGKVGQCLAVTGAAAHGTCPGSGPCGSACNGTDAECVFAGADLDCGSTCADAVLTPRLCDGNGACKAQPAVSCPEHEACRDGVSCAPSCVDTTDCASGFACVSGTCTEPSASCADAVTASGPGGTEDCSPYRCNDGKCRTACRDVADCAPGRLCNRDGNCIADPDAVPAGGNDAGATPGEPAGDASRDRDDSGCSMAGGAGNSSSSFLFASLVALGWLRRSRARGARR